MGYVGFRYKGTLIMVVGGYTSHSSTWTVGLHQGERLRPNSAIDKPKPFADRRHESHNTLDAPS